MGHRQDGRDHVGYFAGEEVFDVVVFGGDAVVLGKFVAALAIAVDQADDFALGMFGEGLQVVAAPHAGAAHYGGAIFLFGQDPILIVSGLSGRFASTKIYDKI